MLPGPRRRPCRGGSLAQRLGAFHRPIRVADRFAATLLEIHILLIACEDFIPVAICGIGIITVAGGRFQRFIFVAWTFGNG